MASFLGFNLVGESGSNAECELACKRTVYGDEGSGSQAAYITEVALGAIIGCVGVSAIGIGAIVRGKTGAKIAAGGGCCLVISAIFLGTALGKRAEFEECRSNC